MTSERVWLAQREYESNIVYQDVFWDKDNAKDALVKKTRLTPSEVTWEPLDYPQDDNEVVDDELELHERLIVKEKIIK